RQVYELTDDGRELATAMASLIAWGARRIGDRKPGESFRARWPAVAMAGLGDREAAKGVSETYQYLVGDSAFHFTVDDGSIELHDGRAEDPAVVLTTDEEIFAEIVSGKLTASSAVASGALTLDGGRQATKRLGKIFGHHQIFTQ